MDIKLNFSDPVIVSPNKEQDILVFHIKEQLMHFVSKPLLKDLH